MKRLFVTLTAAAVALSAPVHAQLKLAEGTTLDFATPDEAREILTRRDDFVERMSPFDRAARMKTDRQVSEAEYLEFVGRNVLAWEQADREKIAAVVQSLQRELAAFSLPWPKRVLAIQTTGDEEGRAAYTRANAIVFPKGDAANPIANLRKSICHELFHVLSRANPQLREKLYAAIGFVMCDEVAFPAELRARKITNPDAPRNDHCIRLQVGGADLWAVPILFSRTEKYDLQRGGEFFRYLEFRFLLVERPEGSSAVKPIYDGPKARLATLREVQGFYEQVGQNTGYILHPEEILADNFELLVLQEPNVRSPEIIKKLEAILKEK